MVFFGRLDYALQFLRSLGPDERPGVLIVAGNVIQQKILELTFRAVHTLRQALLGQNAEETFHQVYPRCMRRRVVEVYARMPCQPPPRRFVGMDVEIVEHQVQFSSRINGHHIVKKT